MTPERERRVGNHIAYFRLYGIELLRRYYYHLRAKIREPLFCIFFIVAEKIAFSEYLLNAYPPGYRRDELVKELRVFSDERRFFAEGRDGLRGPFDKVSRRLGRSLGSLAYVQKRVFRGLRVKGVFMVRGADPREDGRQEGAFVLAKYRHDALTPEYLYDVKPVQVHRVEVVLRVERGKFAPYVYYAVLGETFGEHVNEP